MYLNASRRWRADGSTVQRVAKLLPLHALRRRWRRRRFAGAERGSRVSQGVLDPRCQRVRVTEHAPRRPFRVLERGHGLAEIVERDGGVFVERPEKPDFFNSQKRAARRERSTDAPLVHDAVKYPGAPSLAVPRRGRGLRRVERAVRAPGGARGPARRGGLPCSYPSLVYHT